MFFRNILVKLVVIKMLLLQQNGAEAKLNPKEFIKFKQVEYADLPSKLSG